MAKRFEKAPDVLIVPNLACAITVIKLARFRARIFCEEYLSPDSPAGAFSFYLQKMELRPRERTILARIVLPKEGDSATPRSSLSFWKGPPSVSGLF